MVIGRKTRAISGQLIQLFISEKETSAGTGGGNIINLLKLNKQKIDFNSILQKKIEYALFRPKHKYYEQGERTGVESKAAVYTQTDETDINAISNIFLSRPL